MELPLTPLDLLERARRLFPDRVGVVDGEIRRTYRDVAARCHRLGRALRDEIGIAPGDRVAWLCGNTSELLEAYFGVLLAGGTLLPLNIRMSAPELRFCLDDSGAVVLFRHPDQVDPHHRVPTVLIGDEYEALLARQSDELLDSPVTDESSVAELFYTSGSTGDPKGVLLTHRSLYLHAIHSALTNGIGGDDVVLHTIPLFHVNGWGTPHYLTGLGGVHIMLHRFDPEQVLHLIEAEAVTRLFLVPTMARTLLDHPAMATTDTSSVNQVSVGGAPSGPELLAELEEAFGCIAISGYGMTESSPTLTRSLDKPGEPPSRERRATTGLPILGADVRVFDERDEEVPWDGVTAGEIVARSNHVMEGYWNRPEETAEALRGGWLRTGDVATVDPDGYLTIVDRKKDIIVSGGENVSSVQVEKAIAAHPDVVEVAVVGVPDQRWGEAVKAWVALRPGSTAEEDELGRWVRERLAGFKVPKHWMFVDELPKGGTGKIQKSHLRERE
ncbi:MAG: long-chain-fatty-acid--CoA ligase [Acidimicrobiales bacterium]|nr:long-chain-fatty-acid--CoA ligase [Acidimicrobiales bacterium]